MADRKKKWDTFKRFFSKATIASLRSKSESQPFTSDNESNIDSTQEDTFIIDPMQENIYVIESMENSSFEIEPESKDIFVIDPPPQKEYVILGLDEDVTNEEIKNRYRSLIKLYHPDKGGDPKEFMKIRKAYEMIMQKRSID